MDRASVVHTSSVTRKCSANVCELIFTKDIRICISRWRVCVRARVSVSE